MREPLDLEVIKARAEAATNGQWVVPVANVFRVVAVGVSHTNPKQGITPPYPWRVIAEMGEPDGTAADATFIANARHDVPALVAEVERLRGAAAWVLEQALGDGDRPYGDDLPEAMDQLARLVPAKVRRSCALDEATAISQDLGLYE